MKNRPYILATLAILLILSSCSTRRDKWLNRNWHAMNTRYNGYYNGRLAIQEAFFELGKAHVDDYNKPIQVYKHGNKDVAQAVNPHTDRALEKGAKMIKKHSMLINGEQKNVWIDDCYFLLGQANFIKRETFPAIQQFRHVIQTSENKNMKDIARLWMILSYNDLGEFSQAESEFNHFLGKTPNSKVMPLYQGTMADFFIKSEEYPPAIIPLTDLEKITKKKKLKARYNFIIGQIWQSLGNTQDANDYFVKSIKLKPEYELEFQAAIAVAISTQEGSNNEALKKTLRKMLRDDKNIDYRDQIYYAMGVLSQKENNETLAIEQFTKSAKASTKNKTQKGISYMAIADIFYAKPNYIRAQKYYDSASVNLNIKHPSAPKAKLLAENLKDVVRYSNQISEADSLLTLVSLTPEQQEAKMQSYVDYLLKADKEEKLKQEQAALNALNSTTNPNMLENNGKWYFFNPQTVAFGKQDFKKTWGTRKNEDNWRRKNKMSMGGDVEFVEQVSGSDPAKPNMRDDENPRYDPKTYLALIPKGVNTIDSLLASLYAGHFNLGVVYKDKLRAYPLAVESFNNLLKKSTDNKHVPEVYYQLYIAYKLMGKESDAAAMQNILLTQYGDSDYAKLIKDPSYLAKKDDKTEDAEKAYELAYNSYLGRDYTKVLQDCEMAKTTYEGSPVLAKFSLLKAFASGSSLGKDAYQTTLTETATAYASTTEGKRAQSILEILKQQEKNDGLPGNENNAIVYTQNDNEKHYYIISIPDLNVDLNNTKKEISQFNQTYYRNSNIQIQEIVFGNEKKFLVLKEFPSATGAVTYYKSIDANSEIVESIPSEQIPVAFAISVSNYVKLMKSGTLPEYLKFFFDTYKFN